MDWTAIETKKILVPQNEYQLKWESHMVNVVLELHLLKFIHMVYIEIETWNATPEKL